MSIDKKLNERMVKERFPMYLMLECMYSMYGIKIAVRRREAT